ncbi:dihydrofolate reductase [Halostella salina]|uniref:dihydrofolate reductase n=1 Tax=Halostella salina TaxID=1547897 RepID=UPI000EF7D621|nr:dihydrofolate reductase [Halostella salina]
MEVIAVAAVSENGVIGDGPTLPWNLPEEVRRYRERVAGETVLIGRKTFGMFDDPPGAEQIVLSRSDRSYDDPSVTHAGAPETAIEIARDRGRSTLYVLGGSGVYGALLPHYDRMLLSRVHGEYDGDARFPDFDRDDWVLAEETAYDGYTLEEWRRADG